MKNVQQDLYNKFPSILKEKLKSGEITFPKDTEFQYERIEAYRVIKRKEGDESSVSKNDMKSYAEKNMNKRLRGKRNYDESDPHYYGVSFFTNIDSLIVAMDLPRKNNKIVKGYIYQEGGPQHTVKKTSHVCWWLFENVSFENFLICEGDENG